MTATVDRVGFSGTREGMTPAQRAAALECVMGPSGWDGGRVDLRQGLCVGADSQVVYDVAGCPGVSVFGHPGCHAGSAYRAEIEVEQLCDKVHPVRHPLDRNRDIVDNTDRLVAAPGPNSRGTWHTIRYAMSEGKRVDIVHPSGAVETFVPPEVGT